MAIMALFIQYKQTEKRNYLPADWLAKRQSPSKEHRENVQKSPNSQNIKETLKQDLKPIFPKKLSNTINLKRNSSNVRSLKKSDKDWKYHGKHSGYAREKK